LHIWSVAMGFSKECCTMVLLLPQPVLYAILFMIR